MVNFGKSSLHNVRVDIHDVANNFNKHRTGHDVKHRAGAEDLVQDVHGGDEVGLPNREHISGDQTVQHRKNLPGVRGGYRVHGTGQLLDRRVAAVNRVLWHPFALRSADSRDEAGLRAAARSSHGVI